MSEQDNDPTSFRRITRRDRKRKIEATGPLFPPEDEKSPSDDAQFAPPELREAAAAETADVPQSDAIEGVSLPDIPPKVAPRSTADRFPALPPNPRASSPASVSKPRAAPRARGTCLPNLVAIVFCVGSIAAGLVFSLIYANPYTPLNPFPPFTPLPILVTATFFPATPTLPPTETPPLPTATFTPLPVQPTATLSPFPFVVLNDGAVYIPNANDQGCNWSSIAGTVVDQAGAPLDGYGIRVRGEGIDETVFTGGSDTFGPGGFELFLNGVPTEGGYTIELLSPQAAPLSQEYNVITRATCEENVAVLSFKQIQPL